MECMLLDVENLEHRTIVFTLIQSPSIASVKTCGLVMPLFWGPICGSGPILSKNVEGSGRLVAGIADAVLTVGISLEKVISSDKGCVNDAVIFVGKRLADVV